MKRDINGPNGRYHQRTRDGPACHYLPLGSHTEPQTLHCGVVEWHESVRSSFWISSSICRSVVVAFNLKDTQYCIIGSMIHRVYTSKAHPRSGVRLASVAQEKLFVFGGTRGCRMIDDRQSAVRATRNNMSRVPTCTRRRYSRVSFEY